MKIVEKDPHSEDSFEMMEELSETLEKITGDSGRSSFNAKDISDARAVFVVAYDDEGEAIGCGAIRPINENTAEVKRMYAKSKAKGIGTEILSYLEGQAKKLGYSKFWLETRLVNKRAIDFYERRGYHRIHNYGKYVGRAESVCFEKAMI